MCSSDLCSLWEGPLAKRTLWEWTLAILNPVFIAFSSPGPDVWRGGTMQDSGRPHQWGRHGPSPPENVSLKPQVPTSRVQSDDTCLFQTIPRVSFSSNSSFIASTHMLCEKRDHKVRPSCPMCGVVLSFLTSPPPNPNSRFRDLVYFSDSWIARIKPDVGDNWRLKVWDPVLQWLRSRFSSVDVWENLD